MKIGELVHCPRCNSENPPEYRFCGMCGTPLDKQSENSPRSSEPVNDRIRRVEAPAPSQTLSGPSFLGLGSEPTRGSEDVTYLFEEEQPRRTYWRFIVILLFLGIVGGLGYLQYSKSGRSWTPPWANQKPAPQQQTQEAPPATNPGQNQATPAANPPNGQPAAQNQPGNPPTPKETDLAPGTTQPATPPAGQAQTNTPGAQQPAAAQTQPPAQSSSQQAQSQANPPKAEVSKKQPETTTNQTAAENNNEAADNGSDNSEEAPAAKPKPARVKPAAPVANPDDALVASAEKYLYGRGVPENCDRALVSLRAAADRQNVRARTLLGTMYATGHCVPKDLPNAYRWFAEASRQQTDNMWIQRNLEMIWREMTPQERQLAMQR